MNPMKYPQSYLALEAAQFDRQPRMAPPLTWDDREAQQIPSYEQTAISPDPLIDLGAGFSGGFGANIMRKGLSSALRSGIAATLAEYPIGLATAGAANIDPRLAMPVSIMGGMASGPTFERALSNAMAGKAHPVRTARRAIGNAMGIVSIDTAKKLNTKTKIPEMPELYDAVKNTEGAEITKDGLIVDLKRQQHPDQGQDYSVRTGVFYQPKGSKNKFSYTGRHGYGGSELIEGKTLLKRPMVVKGATGGKAPQAAYDKINGKGAYEKMRQDALRSVVMKHNKNTRGADIYNFLDKYGADTDIYWKLEELENITKGNNLAYALQENIVANSLRQNGYDSIVGYSKQRNGNHFLSEVFDLRETTYPSREDPEGRIHQLFDGKRQTLLEKKTLSDVVDSIEEMGVDSFITENKGVIDLSQIIIPKNKRKQGIGSDAMKKITDYADETKQTIKLTPSTDYGATSVSRLKKFYKKFGFVENKGRNKDYRISDTMYRRPESR
jgi:predicted GNAT family acetyltransferase